MRKYSALIIDIEKSKTYRLEERNEMQQYMSYCIEILNDVFKEEIECNVTFSGGDEMQGLYCNVTSAYLYFRLFELLVKPVKIRAGIGIGEWTVKLNTRISTQQDGPAYHRARWAIEDIYKSQLHNIKINSEGKDGMANHLVNAALPLKNQQIYMQNMVLVVLELLYPFVTEKIHWNNLEQIQELIKLKFQYRLGLRTFSVAGRRKGESDYINMELCEIPLIQPIVIDGREIEPEEVLIIKNATSVISEILNCTRQNVNSIVKRGNAYKIRELDYVALQYLEQTYGGEEWGY